MQLLQMTGFPDNLEIRENAHNGWVTFSSQRMLVEFEKFPNEGHVRDFDWVKKENTHLCDFFFHIRTVLRVN